MISSKINKEHLHRITDTTVLSKGDLVVFCPKNHEFVYYKIVDKQTAKTLKVSDNTLRRHLSETGLVSYRRKTATGMLEKYSYFIPQDQIRTHHAVWD